MRKSNGFTLIELMVVIAIVAILTTLAAPSFKRLIQSNAISSNVNTFLADMRFARSESIRRGGGVVMCRSDYPEASNPVCGPSNDGIDVDGDGLGDGWVSGWIIFVDLNNTGTKTAAEPLLRVQGPTKSIGSIMERHGSNSSTKFRFTATGRLLNLSSATTLQFGGNPTFSNDVQRVVCVSLGGRARISGNGTTDCGTSGL
ncbi:MAG TPA: GspH/FimT family pseudopilin [Rhodoferax sp.]